MLETWPHAVEFLIRSKALEAFLAKRHQADPLRFPDLSLFIVRLMGSGE